MIVQRIVVALVVLLSAGGVVYAQHSQMPPGMSHDEHLRQIQKDADLKRRGAQAMGFDQDATAHHFRLTPSGGVIEVSANDPTDGTSRRQIRDHLKEIADEFRRGVFVKPFATHAEVPPGVQVMQRLRQRIIYTFEETPTGALVRIETRGAEALRAVQDFLLYQINEHATGDSGQ
jgi:hypothetical protein